MPAAPAPLTRWDGRRKTMIVTMVVPAGEFGGRAMPRGAEKADKARGSARARRAVRARGFAWPLLLSLLAAAPAARAQQPSAEELAYGRYLAQECAACHRMGDTYDGANYSGVPDITGRDPEQLLALLQSKRISENPILRDTISTLDEEQLRLIVRYLATIPAN